MRSARKVLVAGVLAAGIVVLGFVAGCGKKSQAPKTDSTSMSSSSSTQSGSTQKGQSGSQVMAAAKRNKSALEAGKSGAETVSTPPQAIPQGTTQGSTTVSPPQPTGDSYLVWQVNAVDLDGDGVTEDGVAMMDSSNTLYVWWSDVAWWSDDELDGFLWIANDSDGFILILDDAVGLACAEAMDSSSAVAGCIGCDDMGDCEEVALTATWNGGN